MDDMADYYRALLIKYMARVIDVEGADFIDTGRVTCFEFTPEEVATLDRLSVEALKLARGG